MNAIKTLLDEAYCINTYRSCYATLVPKRIRGKYRIYLHLTIEGRAMPKFDQYGNPRHKYGKGMIGADIGTQTVAYTSDTEVGLKTFLNVVTVFKKQNAWNAFISEPWTEADGRRILRIIILMEL